MFRSARNPLAASKLVPVLLITGVVAAGSYAFTASNTVGASAAGMGESASISGFNATNVKWTLDASDPTKLAKVEFDLNPVTSSTTVYAGADSGAAIGWSGLCSGSSSGGDGHGFGSGGSSTSHYTCTFASEPAVSSATKLAVSAAN